MLQNFIDFIKAQPPERPVDMYHASSFNHDDKNVGCLLTEYARSLGYNGIVCGFKTIRLLRLSPTALPSEPIIDIGKNTIIEKALDRHITTFGQAQEILKELGL